MPTLHLSGGGGSLTITSTESAEPLYWSVTLVSGGLHASTDIDLDSIRHTVSPIAEFFLARGRLARVGRTTHLGRASADAVRHP